MKKLNTGISSSTADTVHATGGLRVLLHSDFAGAPPIDLLVVPGRSARANSSVIGMLPLSIDAHARAAASSKSERDQATAIASFDRRRAPASSLLPCACPVRCSGRMNHLSRGAPIN
jgi:hypothetical protein